MIRVNLLPEEERAPEPQPLFIAPRRGFLIPFAISLAVLVPLLGMGIMQRSKISAMKTDIAAMEAESRRLQPQIEKIQSLTREQGELNQRILTVRELVRDRYLPVQTLDELANKTPDYLWFTRLTQEGTGEVKLEGETFSSLLVAELMSQMEEGDLFDQVALNVCERETSREPPVVRFTLNARIKR